MTRPYAIRTVRPLDGQEEKTVMGIKIERDVPLTGRIQQLTPGIAACLAMEVGESFLLAGRCCINSHKVKSTGRKFASRKVGNKFRIWRIS